MANKKLFKIGINDKIVGKPSTEDRVNQAKGWDNQELSEKKLIELIRKGYAISAHFKEGYRTSKNFIQSDFIAADIDGTISLDEAIRQPFVQDYCSFAYTTPNHTQERNRFRLVFLLDETITDGIEWKSALHGLSIRLSSDPSIKDAARMFYGNIRAEIFKIRGHLPKIEVKNLILLSEEKRAQSTSRYSSTPIVSGQRINGNDKIKTSTGSWVAIRSLQNKTSICCPFHLDIHPSAFVTRSTKGILGIHCMSCNKTFWEVDPAGYDFEAFDHLVYERAKLDIRLENKNKTSSNFFERYFPSEPSVQIIREKFLPPIGYQPGITLIKSPKGTGKTEALKNLVSVIRKGEFKKGISKKNQPKSILLIGHRQSLIREAAKKLGLSCYLEHKELEEIRDSFSICLDSLHKVSEGRYGGRSQSSGSIIYDIVILDESEQIFSHLVGDTIQNNQGILRAYNALETIIQKAKAVYALDADIGLITAHAIGSLRPKDWHNNCRLVINEPITDSGKRVLNLYQSKIDIENDLLNKIKDKKRCFVVSNSKKTIDSIYEMIARECGDQIRQRKITSDNSRNEVEKNFVINITDEILKIDVLLSSPSLGTGIDISFPNGECMVDCVFGFFHRHINTHADIDQQLSRVRNPGEVSVYFDPYGYKYETDFDIIRDHLARGYYVESAITGRSESGGITYDKNNPLLLIWSHVSCSQRSSKNNIVELFCRLRKLNGWEINEIKPMEKKRKTRSRLKEAASAIKRAKIDRILNADDISDDEVLDLFDQHESGERLTESQLSNLERGKIRLSFQSKITKELIDKVDKGNLEEIIINFQFATQYSLNFLQHMDTQKLINGDINAKITKCPPGFLVALMMNVSGIMTNNKINRSIVFNGHDLNYFTKVCLKNRIVIEEIMKQALRDDLKLNPIRQLNEFLKKIGLKVKLLGRKRLDGGFVRNYCLHSETLKGMAELGKNYRPFETVVKGRN